MQTVQYERYDIEGSVGIGIPGIEISTTTTVEAARSKRHGRSGSAVRA
jgi:hypothetical protein